MEGMPERLVTDGLDRSADADIHIEIISNVLLDVISLVLHLKPDNG